MMKLMICVAVGCFGLLTACDDDTPDPVAQQDQPASYVQDAFRNSKLEMEYDLSFGYTPKDEAGVRSTMPGLINSRMNADGAADGNTFEIADGVSPNLIVKIYISNDGNDHLRASASVYGLGRNGEQFQASSGSDTFVDPANMSNALADDIYSWVHNGWHSGN